MVRVKLVRNIVCSAISICAVLACSHKPEITVHESLDIPTHWQQHKQKSELEYISDSRNAYRLSNLPWLTELLGHDTAIAIIDNVNQNQKLTAKFASIEQAELAIDIKNAEFYPTLDSFLNTTAKNDGVKEYELGLYSSMPLDVWGKLSLQSQQNILSWQEQVIGYRQQQFDLIVEFLKVYFSLLQAERALELILLRQQNLVKQLRSIEKRYQAGLTNLLDVYNARSSVQLINSQVLRSQQAIQQLQRDIPLLLGLPGHQTVHQHLPDTMPMPSALLELPEVLPADLMQQRADIQLAWLSILKQQASVAIAYKERFPSFTLSAEAKDSSDELSQLVKLGSISWQLQLNLFSPIFDAGRRKAKVDQAQLEFEKAQSHYSETTYSAFVQVYKALSQRQLVKQEIDLNDQSYIIAEKSEQLAIRQYQQGLIDYRTMLANQRNFFSAQLNRLNLKYRALNTYLDLLAALGGGWQPFPSNTVNKEALSQTKITNRPVLAKTEREQK